MFDTHAQYTKWVEEFEKCQNSRDMKVKHDHEEWYRVWFMLNGKINIRGHFWTIPQMYANFFCYTEPHAIFTCACKKTLKSQMFIFEVESRSIFDGETCVHTCHARMQCIQWHAHMQCTQSYGLLLSDHF